MADHLHDRIISVLEEQIASLKAQNAALREPVVTVMKAASCSGDIVELDPYSQILAQYFTVAFALRYDLKDGMQPASSSQLSKAFARILPSFEILAGRLTKRNDKLVFICNNAGVPMTVETIAGHAPSFSEPISEELFDVVKGHVPPPEPNNATGDALLRIKVTNFDDAQVMAVCMSHGVCDASGVGSFMSAWSEAYRGVGLCGKRDQIKHDRITAIPPSPSYINPQPLSTTDRSDWLGMRHSLATSPKIKKGAPLHPAVYVTITKTAGECQSLKAKCLEKRNPNSTITFVSTNDAIAAEIAASLACEYEDSDGANFNGGASFPMSLVMDYRSLIGCPNTFGNLFTSVEVLVHQTPAAASEIRAALIIAQDGGFVRWSVGQGANAHFPGRFIMNSWTKAFDLQELAFNSPVSDMMLGTPMLAERAGMMGTRGITYCIALPMPAGGIKAVGVYAEEAFKRIKESGTSRNVTALPCNQGR